MTFIRPIETRYMADSASVVDSVGTALVMFQSLVRDFVFSDERQAAQFSRDSDEGVVILRDIDEKGNLFRYFYKGKPSLVKLSLDEASMVRARNAAKSARFEFNQSGAT